MRLNLVMAKKAEHKGTGNMDNNMKLIGRGAGVPWIRGDNVQGVPWGANGKAESISAKIRKPGNRGHAFWLEKKGREQDWEGEGEEVQKRGGGKEVVAYPGRSEEKSGQFLADWGGYTRSVG